MNKPNKFVEIGSEETSRVVIGEGSPLAFICGPCVIESQDHLIDLAGKIKEVCTNLKAPLIFKASYAKANRTARGSFRGIGIEQGLYALSEVRRIFSLPVISDVHSVEEIHLASKVLDIIQIPAFLCRQTELLETAGASSKPVMVKKGQFLAPEDLAFAIEKIVAAGSSNVIACERGTCFGYRDLVVDYRALPIMRGLGLPVVFDATHSVQVMGGGGGVSAGNREYIAPLARAAVAVGIDGVFIECHENPEKAPSDSATMLPLKDLSNMVSKLQCIHSSI